jgi:hypothetical protein
LFWFCHLFFELNVNSKKVKLYQATIVIRHLLTGG